MAGLASRWGCAVSLLLGSYSWAHPVALVSFNGSTGYGIAPDEEVMDGTNSYVTDPDEWIAEFDWDFGDGTPHSSAGWVRHIYEVPGHFVARLTVVGSRGDRDSATLEVQVDGNSTRWVRLLEESWSSLSLGTTDDRLVLGDDSSLRKFSTSGFLEWERPQEYPVGVGPVVRATGEIYAFVDHTVVLPYGYLVRFNKEGLDPVGIGYWSEVFQIDVVVDDAGNFATLVFDPIGTTITYHGLDGTRWQLMVGNHFYVSGGAIDLEGNLVFMADAYGPVNIQGFDLQPGFTLLKLDVSGRVLWVHQIPGVLPTYGYGNLGLSAIGTVVVAPSFNVPFQWAGQSFHPSGYGNVYLLVAEGVDAEERFGRELNDIYAGTLAVDRVGQVAVAGLANRCSGTVVYKYNLAGDFLWRRELTDQSCHGEIRTGRVGISGHNVILSGRFRGTVDFGKGPETSNGRHFLVNLGP